MSEWIQHAGLVYCKFCQFCVRNNGDVEATPVKCPQCRDRFAMAALTGTLSCSEGTIESHVLEAFQIADAMMNARSRVPDAS